MLNIEETKIDETEISNQDHIDNDEIDDDEYEDYEEETTSYEVDEHTNEMYEIILDSIEGKKCENITSINVSGKSTYADYIIICEVAASKQSAAVVDSVKIDLREKGYDIKGIDGEFTSNWVIIDAHSIIVHLMTKEVRDYYQLEKLWDKK